MSSSSSIVSSSSPPSSSSLSTLLQINIGQAGGQIGSLCSVYSGPLTNDGYGCLFVDSEPKVVAPLVTEGHPQRIPYLPSSSSIWDVNGRGNNWAWGYTNAASRLGIGSSKSTSSSSIFSSIGGSSSKGNPKASSTSSSKYNGTSGLSNSNPVSITGTSNKKSTNIRIAPLLDRALYSIRKHSEALDRTDTILLIHSVGGGTGSGLGSRILETVRDEYSKAVILDAVVAPFSAGDTPLQHYNTILSLASAHEHADAVLFFDNDDILRRARMSARGITGNGTNLMSTGLSASSIADARARRNNDRSQIDTQGLNEIIAEAITGVTLPTRHRKKVPRRKRKEDSGRSIKGRDIGPGWQDIRNDTEEDDAFNGQVLENTASSNRSESKLSSPSDTASKTKQIRKPFSTNTDDDDEDNEYGERGSWITASNRPSTANNKIGSSVASKNVESIQSGKLNVSSSSSSVSLNIAGNASSVFCPFDSLGFIQDLVPSSIHKFLDIRSAAPVLPPNVRNPTAINADSPAASWISIAESMVDMLPRYDKASRPVTTLTSRIIARGATQTDCDSVDPSLITATSSSSLAASSTTTTTHPSHKQRTSPVGMKPIPPHWPGLPKTSEWERVSMMLTRAQNYTPVANLDVCRTSILSPLPAYPTYSNGPSSTAYSIRKHVRTLTMVNNNDVFVAPLVRTLTRGEELLSVKAYIHWYERYNVGIEEITSSMGRLLDVVDAYRPGAMNDAASMAAAISTVSLAKSRTNSPRAANPDSSSDPFTDDDYDRYNNNEDDQGKYNDDDEYKYNEENDNGNDDNN